MFSDRGWILKAAAALLLFSFVCTESDRLLDEVHPEVERVAVFTDDLRSKTIGLLGKKVLRSDAESFDIGSRVGPIRVLFPHPPAEGEYVSLIGRPVGPRTLATSAIQRNAGWGWKRPLNYVVSVLVVIAYGWSVRDRFRWRIPEGVFRGRF